MKETITESFRKYIGKKVKASCKTGAPVVGKVLDVIDSDKGLARIDIEQTHYRKIRVGNITREPKLAIASVYLKNIITVELL
ncbi:hypothetical protein [Emticicia sp. BO119]|uniref:hypothetical protein n=1 Tax=Emticicia sp. BO119 TaxID=2757768 RepID=UPI0015F0C91C|nr:hypothetical protein [Emticicia sp. BO119]MBA4852037.1 hypothetical protein [Emticicia sp. BO119]